jgi:N-acetylmuramoyl-L-alanine amidase
MTHVLIIGASRGIGLELARQYLAEGAAVTATAPDDGGLERLCLTHDLSAAQMAALEALLDGLLARWAIPAQRVIGHSDMAPTRKGDPGARFDWRRLARAGLSVWPDAGPSAPDPAGFAAAARAFGYPDVPFDALLRAVRLRFHPWALGPLDAVDMGIMLDLARRFPVDAGGGHP